MGSFYLGRHFDLENGETVDNLYTLDSKDLCTHAVCVGMTGSGKTGLCVSLLEEAAMDGIPSIVIDPKGDMGNLLLSFPDLSPNSFEPWVDSAEAAKKNLSVEDYAKKIASKWKEGLADWGQGPDRIKRFREKTELNIYTPGSGAGLSMSILNLFASASKQEGEDAEDYQQRLSTSVTALLKLIDVDAEPLQSPEHILLMNILGYLVKEKASIQLKQLIREVQKPKIKEIGALDLDTFMPLKDRKAFALKLNTLLASPNFQSWINGESINPQNLLWTKEGKPKISVISIAHLSEDERMFFVTLLLNEIISWMRKQEGTPSLRALLYMDEVFGFLPPGANPPSKYPMLTLLKQARAYGLGVVLATQNPVDLDYKALSNSGIWMLGRLQTEQDKNRILDGLQGVAKGEFNRSEMDQMLSSVKSRVFVVKNIHESEVEVFHTRWAMSYLRGPLTKQQIKTLMIDKKKDAAAQLRAPEVETKSVKTEVPSVPAEFSVGFALSVKPSSSKEIIYRPELVGELEIFYSSERKKISHRREMQILSWRNRGSVDPWETIKKYEDEALELSAQQEFETASFEALPESWNKAKQLTSWESDLKQFCYQREHLQLWECSALNMFSSPGEDEVAFRSRISQKLHEKRDESIEKLRKKYETKIERIEDRIDRAEDKLEDEEEQLKNRKMQTAISLGASVLGALFGRKLSSRGNLGRVATTMRHASRTSKEKGDIQQANDRIAKLKTQMQKLNDELEDEIAELEVKWDPETIEITEAFIKPKKSDIQIKSLKLVWVPLARFDDSFQPLV